MLTIEQLEKRVAEEQLQTFYLFYGEELFLLDTIVKKIKKKFGVLQLGINYITIDETNLQELIPNLDTSAFGYDKKLILIKNSGLFQKEGKKKNAELTKKKEELLSYFIQNKEMIQQSAIILFQETEIEKQSLFKWIEENGIVCQFNFQKPLQIIKRLKAIANAYHVKVEDSTLNYLLEECGTNMQDLINEIRKLIEYVGKDGTITKQEIDLLSTKQIQAIIFDLTDNLGKKKTKQALEVYSNLLYSKEPVQKILITLYHHFKKLYMVKLAKKEGGNIGSCLNLKPNQQFLVRKYTEQAEYFKEEELRQIIEQFFKLDTDSKVGKIDLELGLQSVLCLYCS